MPQSGPYQSYEIPVNVATIAELARVVVPIEGAPVSCIATGSTWYSSFTLPGGRTVSVDGSSGAIAASNGTYWLQGGAAGSGATFNTVAAGASGSGRLLDVSLAFLLVLNAGAAFFVKSQLAVWRWIPTSTVAADNKTTCNPTANGVSAGRFERDPVGNVVWQNQASWSVAPTLGNDENDGSFASPLATYAEFQRRVGLKFDPPQATTLTFLEDAPNEFANVSLAPTAQVSSLTIKGTLVQQAGPFVVSAVTAINRAGNQEQVVTSTWTATEVNRLAVLADGPNAGASAWVMIDNGAGALSTLPWTKVTLAAPTVVSLPPSVGNTVNTFLPTKLGGISYDVGGSNHTVVALQDLLIDGTAVANTQFRMAGGVVLYQRVKFGPISAPRFDGGFHSVASCLFTVGGTLFGNGSPGAGTLSACGFLGQFTFTRKSVVTITGDSICLTAGGAIVSVILTNGAEVFFGDVFVKNALALSDVFSHQTGTRIKFSGALYGSVVRRVVTSDSGADMIYQSTATWPILCGGGAASFALSALGAGVQTSGHAWDDAAGAYIAAKRNYTFALLVASIATGFAGQVLDPFTTCRVSSTV